MRYAVDLRHSLQAPCGVGIFNQSVAFASVLKYWSRRRSGGNVGILRGFPRGVGRVGSRFYGFSCFPLLVISTAQVWSRAIVLLSIEQRGLRRRIANWDNQSGNHASAIRQERPSGS
jgi:hypothetical protein